MDTHHFDRLVKTLSDAAPRRGLLRLAPGLVLAMAATPTGESGAAGGPGGRTGGKRHGRNRGHHPGKRKGQDNGRAPGAGTCTELTELCTSSDECCGKAICSQNGCATPDRPRCCVGVGSSCRIGYCDCCGANIDCQDRGQGARCYYTG